MVDKVIKIGDIEVSNSGKFVLFGEIGRAHV